MMSPNQPYLIRAIFEWILDNQKTPLIKVDSTYPNVNVPSAYIEDDGCIVLNINPTATRNFNIGNDAVEFDARYSGKSFTNHIPVAAVMAIFARENGHGMLFEASSAPPPPAPVTDKTNMSASKDRMNEGSATRPKGKPKLRIVK